MVDKAIVENIVAATASVLASHEDLNFAIVASTPIDVDSKEDKEPCPIISQGKGDANFIANTIVNLFTQLPLSAQIRVIHELTGVHMECISQVQNQTEKVLKETVDKENEK